MRRIACNTAWETGVPKEACQTCDGGPCQLPHGCPKCEHIVTFLGECLNCGWEWQEELCAR